MFSNVILYRYESFKVVKYQKINELLSYALQGIWVLPKQQQQLMNLDEVKLTNYKDYVFLEKKYSAIMTIFEKFRFRNIK